MAFTISMAKPLVVGITGCSGSGKTFILQKIQENFPKGQLSLISQDNYYRTIHEQQKDENGIENFDIPESINHTDFVADIIRLKKGETVERKEYTFNNSDADAQTITVEPAPIIIVEGIFIFHPPEVSAQLDMKVFVDSPEETMLKRRIKRDGQERGYDLDDVRYRMENHVLPAFRKYILPYREEADVVVENVGEEYKVGLDRLLGELGKDRTD